MGTTAVRLAIRKESDHLLIDYSSHIGLSIARYRCRISLPYIAATSLFLSRPFFSSLLFSTLDPIEAPSRGLMGGYRHLKGSISLLLLFFRLGISFPYVLQVQSGNDEGIKTRGSPVAYRPRTAPSFTEKSIGVSTLSPVPWSRMDFSPIAIAS